MLTREKAVLALLQEAAAPLSSIVLTKLVFLLRHETGIAADIPAFYEFVPYRFGPYSFALHNALAALKRNGYVEDIDGQWQLGRIAGRTGCWMSQLSPSASRTIRYICKTRGSLSTDQLLKHVYSSYPWYASRSELKRFVPERVPTSARASAAVYTAGYQQKTIDAFLAGLLQQGIAAIIDVRSNPVSRNYGYARSTLENLAGKLGLEYRHFPELGVPSAERKGLNTEKQYDSLFLKYRTTVLPREADSIEKVAHTMQTMPATLLCYEADPSACHRSRLAHAVARVSGLGIIHIK